MEAEPNGHSLIDPRNDARFNKTFLLLSFLLGIGLTVSSRLFNLSKYGLWEDEVFSLRYARLGWSALFQETVRDAVHPPLFYMLLKLWIAAGGESLLWLKIFPVIFAVGAIVPLYLLCKDLKIKLAEFCLALIFISLNSYLIYYAQELRMYSLLVFLSLSSMCLFVRFLQDESNSKPLQILLFIVNVLLVYTHYFGWMTVLAEFVVVLLYARSKLKGFLAHTIAIGLCFLPWCVFVVSAATKKGGLAQNLGWIDKPGLSAIPLFLAELHGTLAIRRATALGLLIFLPPIMIWLWQIYKERKREDSLIFALLGLVTGLPILVAFCASQILTTSVWGDRYLIAAAIPYILLLSVSVSRIRNTKIRIVFLTLMVSWSLGVGFWNIFNQRTRVNWIGLSTRILEKEKNERQPAKVFVLEEWTAMPLQQLLDANGTRPPVVQRVSNIEEITEREFWLSYRATTWKEPESPKEKIQRSNCFIKDEISDEIDNDSVHLMLVGCNK